MGRVHFQGFIPCMYGLLSQAQIQEGDRPVVQAAAEKVHLRGDYPAIFFTGESLVNLHKLLPRLSARLKAGRRLLLKAPEHEVGQQAGNLWIELRG